MPNLSALVALLFALALSCLATAASAQVSGLPSLGGSSQSASEPASEPSLSDLIEILENDETRAKLVESLKAAAYTAPEKRSDATVAEPAETAAGLSVPGQIAYWTQAAIASAFVVWTRVEDSAEDAQTLLSGAGTIDVPRLIDAILPVVLVALVVFTVFFATRLIKAPVYARLAKSAEHSGPLRKLFLLAVCTVADLASVLLSWAGGYVAAIVFFGGPPNINQALFLNAFLAIEAIKAVFAHFVSPAYPQLRLTPFGDAAARYWYGWIARLASILGYTFLFVGPIVEQSSSLAAANAIRFIVAFLSLCLIVFLILRNRVAVRHRLARRYHFGDRGLRARSGALFGHVWWIPAIAFVVSLFSVWLSSPEDGLRFMVVATLKSVAAMTLGGLAVTILSKVILSGIPVPDAIKERLPLLERRVNSFIPNALTVIRVIVVAIVLGVVLEAWSVFDFGGWVETESGRRIVSGLIGSGVVVMLGFAVYLGISSWIEYRLNPNFGKVPTARERTLLALFRNGFTITLLVITVMLVLSQVGINIGPLLAGAGVVGLAVGFGAQKLVQDIITGAFIQLENAMNVGDVVQVSGVSGTVERLTIRSVGLRSIDGTYHLIPFSSVDQVANMTKDFSQFVADVGVAYRENTDDVKLLMADAYALLAKSGQGPNLIGDFEMFGVNELGTSSVVVRGRIKTLPGKQWAVGRAYNEIVKRLCDERGIELPFPNTTIWFGEDKRGNAPPVHLASPSAPSRALAGVAEAAGKELRPPSAASDRGRPGTPPDVDDIEARDDGSNSR